MFSSDNNSYPIYYHHQSSAFTNVVPESNNILFQPYNVHHGKTNNYMMQPTYPPIPSENPMFKSSSQPLINQDNTINYPLNLMNHISSTRKPAVKKDRHTKICTAQGVRDRRVRLSMSIAREFFNLQDMLGFDKASKTLGWLLAKSKAAIDELASTSSSNIIDPINDIVNGEEEEDNNNHNNNDDDAQTNETKDEASLMSTKRKKRESSSSTSSSKAAEVSDKEDKRREKARERARERTKMKKIVDDQNLLTSLNHQLRQRMQQGLMICDSSSAAIPSNNETPSYGGLGKGFNVQESVLIKDNNKSKSGSSYNTNYELISPKNDQESCNDYDYFNKSSSESCNYGGSGIIQPPPGLFPALNIINLSTEIHINGRPWDACSNQILH